MTARDWLQQHGYEDIVVLIDEVTNELHEKGSKQRRNWWDVLAGGVNGKPVTVEGRTFPVLRAAQRRQGKPVTSNAIQRNRREAAPPIRQTGRWQK